jgi:type I restriction enzyme M protein
MASESSTIIQRLWNQCNVLRDDGMSYGDYVEQLTYLLFLKMDDEKFQVLGKPSAIPTEYNWASLRKLSGDELESHYRQIASTDDQIDALVYELYGLTEDEIKLVEGE